MTLANAKARVNRTFIVQASLTIITYNRQNIKYFYSIGHETKETKNSGTNNLFILSKIG
jgi:hypothetical protein